MRWSMIITEETLAPEPNCLFIGCILSYNFRSLEYLFVIKMHSMVLFYESFI